MEPAEQDNRIDVADLQKEVIEMRQQIPSAYRHALEKDFDMFKQRLTNVIAQRGSTPQLHSADTMIDSGLFNIAVHYGEEQLKQYIENAEVFVKNLKKDEGKKKKCL
ncbi:hypothetical protein HA402_012563 [Bradysia odoriphaga]|nr:hypothetical protein HA402_012563 [Bradysia odoriphaga]